MMTIAGLMQTLSGKLLTRISQAQAGGISVTAAQTAFTA